MSPSLKSADPATSTVAPASTQDFPVNSLTPPSTDISSSRPFSAAQSLTYEIFGMHSAMKDCPPNPGWTVMMRTRSTRGRYSSSSVAGVSGFTDMPAFIPLALISWMAPRMSPIASQCTVTRSHPASAKSLTYLMGSWIIRWASNGMSECFLMAFATVGAFALAIYERSGDYNEAIAVMLFYQIGELFQSYAVGRSRSNISDLMDIRPDYANIEAEGRLEQVDPEEVPVGSVIVEFMRR